MCKDEQTKRFENHTLPSLIDDSLSIFDLAMKAYKEGRKDEARKHCAELNAVMCIVEHENAKKI